MTDLAALDRSIRRGLRTPAARSYADDTHAKQGAFILDRRRRVPVLGGRRGGKSHGLGRRLLLAGERHRGATSVYVTLTLGKARQILWDDCLAKLNQDRGLGLKLVDRNALYVYQPNGSRIWLVGVDDKAQVEKIRGGKYSEVVIDEAMAMPDYLRSLVTDAAEPALVDLKGACVLAGTPCPQMAGYFFEVTTGDNPQVAKWDPVHHFTMLDNPFIEDAEGELARVLAENFGGNPEHPTFRREYLGEWVEDIGALVYPFTWDANSWVPEGDHPYGLPPGEYSYGLGIDLGYGEQSTGFVLAARRLDAGQVYILKAYTESRWDAIKVAAHVKRWRERIRQQTDCGLRVVVDEGGLGKGYADQMRDLGVGCEAAVKAEKRAYQDYVQGLILGRSVKVHYAECKPLIDEARKLQFDAETGKEDERYVNHACDAFLYVTRSFFPIFRPKEYQPKPGSPEALTLEMKKERQARIDERERRLRRD